MVFDGSGRTGEVPFQRLQRRDLTIGIETVEVKFYRRTRTSSDIVTAPPHFVYTIRCSWGGETLPHVPGTGPRPGSPRSPRNRRNPRQSLASTRSEALKISLNFEAPWEWWASLPQCYSIRRKWIDIVRFHESLKSELAFDPILGCNRVKARVPDLPDPGDLDAWLRSYAATGDACALVRKHSGLSKDKVQCLDELGDLHWMYVQNRLKPYFIEVNKVLEELPTEVLASSRAVRRFVTGGIGLGKRGPPSALPVPPRFMGPLLPLLPNKEDLEAAVRIYRTRSDGALTGSSRKGFVSRPSSSSSSAVPAAAKLLLKGR